MMISLIDQADRKKADAFIVQQWYTMQMAVHGDKPSIMIELLKGDTREICFD